MARSLVRRRKRSENSFSKERVSKFSPSNMTLELKPISTKSQKWQTALFLVLLTFRDRLSPAHLGGQGKWPGRFGPSVGRWMRSLVGAKRHLFVREIKSDPSWKLVKELPRVLRHRRNFERIFPTFAMLKKTLKFLEVLGTSSSCNLLESWTKLCTHSPIRGAKAWKLFNLIYHKNTAFSLGTAETLATLTQLKRRISARIKICRICRANFTWLFCSRKYFTFSSIVPFSIPGMSIVKLT